MFLKNGSSIYLIPNETLSSNQVKFAKLKHPNTKIRVYFLFDEENKKIYELQNFDMKFRSWFIKENVISNGCIKMVTLFNPLFIILPYLIQMKKNVPLEHLLIDDEFPALKLLVNYIDASVVADSKGPADLNVWCYNEEKTLNWLTEKVHKLSNLLVEKKEKPSLACSLPSDKAESYHDLAFGILNDCLCEEVSKPLSCRLGLDQKEDLKENKNGGEEIDNKPPKKQPKINTKNNNSVEEGYNMRKKAAAPPKSKPPSARAKALAQSAKGTKNITNFFGRK